MRWVLFAALGFVVIAGLALWLLGRGVGGQIDSDQNVPRAGVRPAEEVREAEQRQIVAARGFAAPQAARQILFGDLHVHTTISFDAFMQSLPIAGGEGAHPPQDACDFARHCAALDFWSINDHAANILPSDWQNTVEGIRRCNAVAGDPQNPDTVAFLGWEWTQMGRTPETHYGHKNVVLGHTEEGRIPRRPIAARLGGSAAHPPSVWTRGALALQDARFRDAALRWTTIGETPACPDAESPSLPDDCVEVAPTPEVLFRKLDEWGHDAIVIPHGTAWGIYTPPGSTWDRQLAGHDPDRQTLIEMYSGHGDSEVYRSYRGVQLAADGSATCPEATTEHTPMCQRAGEIIRERCLAEGTLAAECDERAAEARRNAAEAGVSAYITVPGTRADDWLEAGQCADCDQPAFNYRPGGSAQYIAAIGDFSWDAAAPKRFRLGFIASSDIHRALPGIGYKELRALSEVPDRGEPPRTGVAARFMRAAPESPGNRSRTLAEAARNLRGIQLFETERQQSFLYTGGLVAVHADGRDRASIWSGLERKEVYGTSGPRILLWFDLVNDGETVPMGAEAQMNAAPTLRVRAAGSFEQAPGCPEYAHQALGAEQIQRLCHGECYHPTDVRRPISRIEVVRIRPQSRPDEDVGQLIDDPWRSFECSPDPGGCEASFTDDDFTTAARDTVYYARVFEPPIPTVNGDTLGCTRDADGRCVSIAPCGPGRDCLGSYEPRAWSSPIYVDYAE